MRFAPRSLVSPPILALVTFAALAVCGHKSETKPLAHVPFAYLQPDCGPTDGGALVFYFTLKQSQSGEYQEPFVEISINENLPRSAPRDYTIMPGRSGNYAVLASRCTTHGKCETATSGTLHLSAFSPAKGITGEYELHFQDGSVERDAFDATWVVLKQPLLCG
jgi:hypothetical protein